MKWRRSKLSKSVRSLPVNFCFYALVVGGGWNAKAGNTSKKWRSLSAEERAAFVEDVEQKIDAFVAELPLNTLINEQNSKAREYKQRKRAC